MEKINIDKYIDQQLDDSLMPLVHQTHHAGTLGTTSLNVLVSPKMNSNNPILKKAVALLNKGDYESGIRLLEKVNHSSDFSLAMYQFIATLLDPFKYQFHMPIPFASNYSLFHYTFTSSSIFAVGLNETIFWDATYPTKLSRTDGLNIVDSAILIPSNITDLFVSDSIIPVSVGFRVQNQASAIASAGTIYAALTNTVDKALNDTNLVNTDYFYTGALVDGLVINRPPVLPLGGTKSDEPIIAVKVSSHTVVPVLTVVLVFMLKYKPPYNALISKIGINYGRNIYDIPFGDFARIRPDCFMSSISQYESNRMVGVKELCALMG